jgi:cytoplasmic iron level regulating protein YaaA (DUF328/UPF0246 family)
MLILLSPAKSLDFDRAAPPLPLSEPVFATQAAQLIKVLAKKRPRDIAQLMSLSDKLAELNVQRYKAWTPDHTPDNSRAALLAFDGDVYLGLQASTLSTEQLSWANDHIRCLSGLYGVLRPLDRMQAYRLEMGTQLTVGKAHSLYQFWGKKIATCLNDALAGSTNPEVINLASQEYFKSVDLKTLKAPVTECVFQEGKDGQFRVLGFFAKRARGLMSRYAIEQRIDRAEGLKDFQLADYRFAPRESTPHRWVFRRTQPPGVAE